MNYAVSIPLPSNSVRKTVEFCSQTGEEEIYNAVALKIEFFQKLLKRFHTRVIVSESNSHVPRRGESVAFSYIKLPIQGW